MGRKEERPVWEIRGIGGNGKVFGLRERECERKNEEL
jgi:hypothetical protein